MNRRQFSKLALIASASLSPLLSRAAPLSKKEAEEKSKKAHEDLMAVKDGNFKMMGEEHIGMVLYQGFAALDMVAPHYLFASMMGAKIYLISPTNDLSPVISGEKLAIIPTHTQQDCPKNLDVLFVPGGATGTLNAMKNTQLIDFIANRAATAKYITSVCTGSLLLGKAGLLKDKQATSHWVTLELLPEFGAIPVKQRVVHDGNIVTGGGVTAGLDFGLEIVAALRGKLYAEAIQLQAEYDPAPPYNSGSPDKASPFIKDSVAGIFAPLVQSFREAV